LAITPIFTHALALAEAKARFRVAYACRSRHDLELAEELRERIGDRLQTFPAEDARVDLPAEIAKLDRQGEFYVCGPIGLLEAAKRALARYCVSRPSAAAAATPRRRSTS
jgi:vanillate O-demethylase ferredoxin subunit